MDNIKAVIFDLDGTLLNTEPIEKAGWNHALERYGIVIDNDEYLTYCGHMGPDVEIMICEKHGLDIQSGELTQVRKEYVSKWIANHEIEKMPFALDILDFLKKEGCMLALATSSKRDMMEKKLFKSGIRSYFQVTNSRDDVTLSKPDPEIYQLSITKLGYSADDCLVIEDTQSGVEAAATAGIRCFAVPQIYSSKQDFSAADMVFDSHKSIIEHLLKNKQVGTINSSTLE